MMLKALAGDTIILGLSRMNVTKLQEGKPISFDGKDIGLPGKKFVILFGETELAMAEALGADMTAPDTPAH
jgi:hypothetical protein